MNSHHCRLGRSSIIVAAVFSLAFSTLAAAATLRSIGPFDVTFYNMGESAVGYTGEQDWTEEQIADIGAAVALGMQSLRIRRRNKSMSKCSGMNLMVILAGG